MWEAFAFMGWYENEAEQYNKDMKVWPRFRIRYQPESDYFLIRPLTNSANWILRAHQIKAATDNISLPYLPR